MMKVFPEASVMGAVGADMASGPGQVDSCAAASSKVSKMAFRQTSQVHFVVVCLESIGNKGTMNEEMEGWFEATRSCEFVR